MRRTETPSKYFQALLTLIVVLLLTAVSVPRALGQPSQFITVDGFPVAADATSSTEPSDSTKPVDLPVTAIAGHGPSCRCQLNYWIVSSRSCDRQRKPSASACQFEFLQCAGDGQLHQRGQQRFVKSLQLGVPVCVVVHGSYVTPADVVPYARATYHWLRHASPDKPLNVVFYTWPSEGIFTLVPHNGLSSLIPQIDVAILGNRAEVHGEYLARLITQIPVGRPIGLIGHSHGARLVSAAAHLLGGGSVRQRTLHAGDDPGNPIRIVFAAAAMDHDWLNPGENFDCVLNHAECVLNLRNRRDLTLQIYPLRRPFSRRALAVRGFTRKDLSRMGGWADKISEWDVTELIGRGHLWPRYFNQPAIAETIVPYVFFPDREQPGREQQPKTAPLQTAKSK